MQTALLVFIVIFALAIGFFLGLFLLSLNSPLLNKLFQKDEPDSRGNLPGPAKSSLRQGLLCLLPKSRNPAQIHGL